MTDTAMYRVVFLGSTGGAVLSRLVSHEFVRELTHEVVADRPCGFLQIAEQSGMATAMLPANNGHEFSMALHRRYDGMSNLIFLSFYTRLLTNPLLDGHKGRLFNCHPSVLPSFKGMHGFDDTYASSSLFMGCTLHQIDAGIDTGPCVLQAALPIDRRLPKAQLRHGVFLAQYYSALQFLLWLKQGRLVIDATGHASVRDLQFRTSPFSPNLDADFFAQCGIPNELI